MGTHGLTALLITSPSGHILIDRGLMESAPLIAANIRTLGFRLEEVRVLLNTHVHYDHASGLAALQRLSGGGGVRERAVGTGIAAGHRRT